MKSLAQSIVTVVIAMTCMQGCSTDVVSPVSTDAKYSDDMQLARVGTIGASDIGVGWGSNKSVWAVSRDSAPAGGCYLYKWVGTAWAKSPSGAGVRIAVDNFNNPWVINSAKDLFCFKNGVWIKQTKKATDIAIGANGDVWIVSNEKAAAGGFLVYKRVGDQWQEPDVQAAAVRIAVDPNGIPWIVNSENSLFYKYPVAKGAWIKQTIGAKDVGIVDDGTVLIVSTVPAPSGGYCIYRKLPSSQSFFQMSGAGIEISNYWVINTNNDTYQWVNDAWQKR